MIGTLNARPIIPLLSKDYLKKYQLEDDKVVLSNGEVQVYPVSEILKLQKDTNSGYYIKIEIYYIISNI